MALEAVGPVLLAADASELARSLRDALRAAGYSYVQARTVPAALEALHFHRPAVAIVDLALQGGRGWDVLRACASRPGSAALAVDRANDPLARRVALASGADDAVSPPFDPDEVAARVRALMRRVMPVSADRTVYRHRDLVLDLASHEVRVGGRLVALTPQQFAILEALFAAAGSTLHRSQLIARISAIDDEPPSDRAVDLHVSRLRRRLGDGQPPRYVEAVYGVGYRLSRWRDDTVRAVDAPAVLDAIPEAVLVLDGDLTIRAANRSAEALVGRPQAELAGRACTDVMGCRACGGEPLPVCLGQAALAGASGVVRARAAVRGADGPVEVVFSHVPFADTSGTRGVAISIRPADR